MNQIEQGGIIGMVGDGQLGRMLTIAARDLGFRVIALGSSGLNSPAAQVGATQLDGDVHDMEAIMDLAKQVDVMTWELEDINQEALSIAEAFTPVHPSPASLAIIQDKYRQKLFLRNHGLDVVAFDPLDGTKDLVAARARYGNIIAKKREGSYDGYGNFEVTPQTTWEDLVAKFGTEEVPGPKLYFEEKIELQRELAVIGARDYSGRIALYPVVETEQKNGICNRVFAPADISPKTRENAEEFGRETIKKVEGAGVVVVEMLQDGRDNLTVNEMALRVHNSGHFTIEGSETSQFTQDIRAITGMPLGRTDMLSPAAVMVNILGKRGGEFDPNVLRDLETPNAKIHWYGKTPRLGRKLGHITVLAAAMEGAMVRADDIRRKIDV